MVRIKHRYLLVQILYPDVPTTLSSKDVPDIVHFRRPTIDDLTPALLSRAIKDQIGLLYGDYGVGITAGGLTGEDFGLNIHGLEY
jgi:ribonuclease P/MRP protein subunit POP5